LVLATVGIGMQFVEQEQNEYNRAVYQRYLSSLTPDQLLAEVISNRILAEQYKRTQSTLYQMQMLGAQYEANNIARQQLFNQQQQQQQFKVPTICNTNSLGSSYTTTCY